MYLIYYLIIFQIFNLVLNVSLKEDTEEDNNAILCKDKAPNEYFRLSLDDNCREVVQCSDHGLIQLKCSPGLVFDIEKQTCDWKINVKNCDQLQRPRIIYPILATDEPICDLGKLACGNRVCIDKELFCNGEANCEDGSDENACTIDKDPNRSPICNTTQCTLPDCFCSLDGTKIPGGLEANKIPQMILLSFDDAINNNNFHVYNKIFSEGRTNPNSCSIKATFFISHKYTNYSAVQNMHYKGHEIAAHSITHNSSSEYWSYASVDQWAKEIAGSRFIIERFANITDNSIVGVRAPQLRTGGNNQFFMMEDQAFLYDSTLVAPITNPPLWPYSLHFRIPHKCFGNNQNCPTRSFPIWEIVMNQLDRREDPINDEILSGCAMIDQCTNIASGEQFTAFLNHNFDRHYKTNRAPFGLYFHASWFKTNSDLFDSFTDWLDEILKKEDVYFVTMTQALQWIQSPTEISQIRNFAAWKEKCVVNDNYYCVQLNQCPLTTRELPGETLRLHTCKQCSRNYPWIEDPTGDYFAF